jgi:hypothetical protein
VPIKGGRNTQIRSANSVGDEKRVQSFEKADALFEAVDWIALSSDTVARFRSRNQADLQPSARHLRRIVGALEELTTNHKREVPPGYPEPRRDRAVDSVR